MIHYSDLIAVAGPPKSGTKRVQPPLVSASRHTSHSNEGMLYVDAYRLGEASPTAEAILASKPTAILTDRHENFTDSSVLCFGVGDVKYSLGELAQRHRSRFNINCVAVTGSTGKSSTTAMIHAALPKPSHATIANENDELGVPVTVLGLNEAHLSMALEIGTWRPGEVSYCASIGKPMIGIVTNIGLSHLERFGNQKAIADAKKELFLSLPVDGVVVVNDDDIWSSYLLKGITAKRILRFSIQNPLADGYITSIREYGTYSIVSAVLLGQKVEYLLPMPGRQMAVNSVAAALAIAPIMSSLEVVTERFCEMTPPPRRLERRSVANDIEVLDDSFNASLDSVVSLAEVLLLSPRRKIVVFGGIAELGHEFDRVNMLAIDRLRSSSEHLIILCSPLLKLVDSIGTNGIHYANDIADVLLKLESLVEPGDLVAFKGSRASQVSVVVDLWCRSCEVIQ